MVMVGAVVSPLPLPPPPLAAELPTVPEPQAESSSVKQTTTTRIAEVRILRNRTDPLSTSISPARCDMPHSSPVSKADPLNNLFEIKIVCD